MDDWQYGRVSRASAYRLADRLIVRVEGVIPTPWHQVELRECLPDGDHPADVRLGLYWKEPPGAYRRQRTQYVVRTDLRVGRMAVDTVRIDNADPPRTLAVQPVPFSPLDPSPDGGELYTGWSRTSFEEAYRNAVARVPRRGAEDLVRARIVDQGGLHGGAPGLDDLFVTVRRVDVAPPPAPEQGVDGARSAPR